MNDLSANLSELLTNEELAVVGPLMDRLSQLEEREKKQQNFMDFVKHVWPGFIEGRHHKIYAQKFRTLLTVKSSV